MAEFKLVIGTKSGKCVQREIKEADANSFLGKKIGQSIAGESFGLSGYEFLITGGSDNCGFPMRQDLEGSTRRKIFVVAGSSVGLKKKKKSKGCRIKKSVAGNTVFEKTAQINLKLLKGDEKALLAPAEEKPAEGEEKKE